MKGLDYRWIEALDSVVKTGGFDKAANALYVTQSAVSQRIKQLERFVAQPVLVRDQPPRPTPLGQKLLGFYQRIQLLEQELIPEISNQQPLQIRQLSIATNADSLATWLLPALSPVLKKHPLEMRFEVDREGRTLNKLKQGEVVGAISMASQALSGCVARYLGRMDYICVATPQFRERFFPQGLTKEALSIAPAVSFDQHDPLHRDFLKQHGIDIDRGINHWVSSSEAFVNMVLNHCAYCLIPTIQIEKELEQGTLVDLLPGFCISFEMYWHHWQLETGLLKEVSEAILSYAQQHLIQPSR